MIYTDGVHLVSDESLEELHKFARGMGLKRRWFQRKDPRNPHYDLTTQRAVKRALDRGATLTDGKGVVLALYRLRGEEFPE